MHSNLPESNHLTSAVFNHRKSAGKPTAVFPRRCKKIEDTQIFADLIVLIDGQPGSISSEE